MTIRAYKAPGSGQIYRKEAFGIDEQFTDEAGNLIPYHEEQETRVEKNNDDRNFSRSLRRKMVGHGNGRLIS
jgi:hypothetical protein